MITSTQCYHETHVTQYILCSQYHKIYRKVNRCWLSILTTMLLSSLLSSCIMKEIFLFSVIKIFSLISYCKSQIFAPAWIQLELFLSVVCVKSLFFFSHTDSHFQQHSLIAVLSPQCTSVMGSVASSGMFVNTILPFHYNSL